MLQLIFYACVDNTIGKLPAAHEYFN